jgi:gliding motility-associated-like protein
MPTFQWEINGVATPYTGFTFVTSNLNDGDVVSCIVTVDPAATCAVTRTAVSNSIPVKVSNTSPTAVSITSSDNNFCAGKAITFTATTQNAGTSPSYQWLINGNKVGSNSLVYTDSILSNGDNVSCVLTTTNACSAVADYTSNVITMSVKAQPVIAVTPIDTTVVPGAQVQLTSTQSGNVASYTWSPAASLVSAQTTRPFTIPMLNTTTYKLKATTSEGCEATAEAIVRVKKKLFMPTSFTPNGDGKNEVFMIPPGTTITLKEFSVFGRWGNKIFSTSDITKGWDGKLKGVALEAGTYIYMISATNEQEDVFMKGTVVLLR